MRIADANIREYARLQLPVETLVDYPDGRRLGQIVRPLDSMGAYTPAGGDAGGFGKIKFSVNIIFQNAGRTETITTVENHDLLEAARELSEPDE